MCSGLMSSPHSHKKRGSYKKGYQKSDLIAALTDYHTAARRHQPISFAQAATNHHVPPSTLRRAERKNQSARACAPRYSIPFDIMETAILDSRAGQHLRLLTDELEEKLVTWINSCKELAQPPDV